MKKNIVLSVLAVLLCNLAVAQEFKIITIVESIVPAGLGRSRIVETTGQVSADSLTTQREGDLSKSNEIKRGDLKDIGDNLKETKLLNFYSIGGINFGNIASNDAIISSKINEMIAAGWKVAYITSGVESDGGKEDGNGIFITRIYFNR
jgi:hypothetical protein